jgi:hypothetical protein
MAERNALLGRSPLSALDSVAAPEDAADPEVTVPESGLSAVRDAIKRRQTLQTSQQAFLDNIARQLAERRTGPSNRERLFELSAALARPTTVRGFSGLLNNVMPVLQQQAKASRVGAEGRAEALTAMQLAQNKGALELADQEVDTEVKLAELMAKANKPVAGINVNDVLTNPYTGERIGPKIPTLTLEQAIAARQNPANRGKRFLTPDGQERVL